MSEPVLQANPALLVTLELAVPLWIERVRSWSPEVREGRARECAQVVAEKGDVLQFGGRKGEAAHAFNHLAEGLAIAAFSPGGVKFAGFHWEADPVYSSSLCGR